MLCVITQGGVDLVLNDNSPRLPGVTIDEISWGIDGTVVNSTTSVSSGTHTIAMDIEYTYNSNIYVCSTSEVVTFNRGIADFSIAPCPYCSGTLIDFTDLSTGAVSWNWNLGNGSINTTQDPDQAYDYNDGLPFAITLTITDAWGCQSTHAQTINVSPNVLANGGIRKENADLCLGEDWRVFYEFDDIPTSTISYLWQPLGLTTTVNEAFATQTGDYYVEISDDQNCYHKSTSINLAFGNTPLASISGDDSFCQGETVELAGFSGGNNAYQWTLLPATLIGNSANISLNLAPNTYNIQLEVTDNLSQCSATDLQSIVVHQAPNPPSISLGANYCIHNPTVDLISNSGAVYWSTGDYGSSTETYNSGFHTAYSVNIFTGCASDFTYLLVPKKPDFNELLSGCYDFCEEDLPQTVLGPSGNWPAWTWENTNGLVQSGFINIGMLNIPVFSTYNLNVNYYSNGSNNCFDSSPDLVINEVPDCDGCDLLEVTIDRLKNPVISECNLIFDVTVSITNTSAYYPATLTQINSNFGSISSGSPVINPGQTFNYTFQLQLDDYSVNEVIFDLVFIQNGVTCTETFTGSIIWDGIIQNCISANYIDINYNSSLSGIDMSYFDLVLGTDVGLQNVQVYSNQDALINFTYNPINGKISALHQITPSHLQEIIDQNGTIDFVIYGCKSNLICSTLVSIPVNEFMAAKNSPIKRSTEADNDDALDANTIRLMPNPANTHVNISSNAELLQIEVLDMNGKVLLEEYVHSTRQTDLNIEHLESGLYIVKISDANADIHYLKLIKQ